MSTRGTPPTFSVGVDEPLRVDGVTYFVTRADRLGNGSYRIEAAEHPGSAARWLVRGKGLWRGVAGDAWQFMHYATVVELTR